MNAPAPPAFEAATQVLPMSALLPMRNIPPAVRTSSKYRQIASSIAEVGVIEPLVVARARDRSGHFILLDGHLRHGVLLASGAREVRCLISTDDEGFTYNKRISRLPAIQEHLMVNKAIDRGVSEERLAKALNLDVRAIRRRRTLLVGIAPEVVDLLKDKSVNPTTFEILRKMRPMRQIEAAELMNTAGIHTASYAKLLLAATPQSALVKPEKPKKVGGLTAEQTARMENEMEALQKDIKGVESGYGDDVLNLVIGAAYVAKVLANSRINRYLSKHHPELQAELNGVVAAASLDQSDGSGAPEA